jgi:hypothetical protein
MRLVRNLWLVVVPDVGRNRRFSPEMDENTKFEIGSIVAMPMRHRGRCFSVIDLTNCIGMPRSQMGKYNSKLKYHRKISQSGTEKRSPMKESCFPAPEPLSTSRTRQANVSQLKLQDFGEFGGKTQDVRLQQKILLMAWNFTDFQIAIEDAFPAQVLVGNPS